jgi:MFS family permease
MNELKQLESMGLVLPTPAYILGAIVFGIIGYLAYRRGRKEKRPILVWIGVALMLYPYAISETWLLWGVGAALCGWLFTKWNEEGSGGGPD